MKYLILFLTIATQAFVTIATQIALPNGDNLFSRNNYTGSAGTLRRAVSDWIAGGTLKNTVTAKYGPIEDWDVSEVTNMYMTFYGVGLASSTFGSFNADLSKWDTSAVTNMEGMFFGASNFNSDLSKWDTSAVTYMGSMFKDSGFSRTLCGGAWESFKGASSAFNNTGSSTARYGCCSPGTFMEDPMLNPFSKADACVACPTGKHSSVDNDETECDTDSTLTCGANFECVSGTTLNVNAICVTGTCSVPDCCDTDSGNILFKPSELYTTYTCADVKTKYNSATCNC
jgi:surface protein